MNRQCLAALSATIVAGCATRVPQVLTPQVVPSSFSEQTTVSEGVWPNQQWWTDFGSPQLAALIDQAQTGNRDLAVAAARVLQAQAQRTIRRSALWPQISGQAQAARASSSGSASTSGNAPASSSQPANATSGTTANTFGLSVGATYELDIWGLQRADLRAASETLKAARFAERAVALTITANVANAYFAVLTLRERMTIANEDITAINSLLDVIKLRVATGKSSHLDLAQEQAQVEGVEAQLPVLEQQELQARVSLAVLLGRAPESLEIQAESLAAIRVPSVGPGLASDLLSRRPDVAQVEANLASAHASVDAARAAFLPQFSLTGNAGYASTTMGTLLRGPSFIWDAGANLLHTIFDAGKLIGQERLAVATQQELVASYQSAVLNAYADVESALGQVSSNRKSEEHLRREVASAREAFDIAQLQYRQGAADLLIVLQTQQTLFGARDQLAQTHLARLQAIVHLYEALGGGWLEPVQERTQGSFNGRL